MSRHSCFCEKYKTWSIKQTNDWQTNNKSLCLLVSSASESESDVSPEKRARVGEVPEGEESSSSFSSTSSSSSSSRSGSKQRSRKRCHRCQTKLELVQQELGSCRCGTTIHLYTHVKHTSVHMTGTCTGSHTHSIVVADIKDLGWTPCMCTKL